MKMAVHLGCRFFVLPLFLLGGIVEGADAKLTTVDQEPSPINRIQADYLCTLANHSQEQVAFSLPSRFRGARVWLTADHKTSGLEAQVESFTYRACEACFVVEAHYLFSGSQNHLRFETQVETGRSPIRLFAASDDLPPGAEEPPPGSDDVPPGSQEPTPVDPPSPTPPPQSGGPSLVIHYQEKSRQGRIIYQAEGRCESVVASPIMAGD